FAFPVTNDSTMNGVIAGFHPLQVAHHCGLNYYLPEPWTIWVTADAREVVIEPFHDLAQHEMVLRRGPSSIPSLGQTGGSLLKLITVARLFRLVVYIENHVGAAPFSQCAQKVAVTDITGRQRISSVPN